MRQIKLLAIVLASLFLILGCSSDASPSEEEVATETAENNTETKAEEQAEREDDEEDRIISTTVAIVEMIEALDLDLVGIPTTYKDLGPRYKDLQPVGIANEPDM